MSTARVSWVCSTSGCVGCVCSCCCCVWFAALSCGRRAFSCGPTVFAFWGHALLSARIPLVVKLHCVGLRFGEREGLLAAAGSGKSGCSSCFADASERGVSPRLEVGGSACFALALPSLCARSPGCGCFCLRLDFQVTVSVRGKSTLGSSCLPLARGSCRAVGFRQDECRPGVWFVALLHVVVRFRAVHRCCVLGCGFPLKISLWLSCLHCVGFQQSGGSGRGFLSRGLLAASGSCKTSCSSCFADASERGVSPRLEVGGISLFCAGFALALRVAVAFV